MSKIALMCLGALCILINTGCGGSVNDATYASNKRFKESGQVKQRKIMPLDNVVYAKPIADVELSREYRITNDAKNTNNIVTYSNKYYFNAIDKYRQIEDQNNIYFSKMLAANEENDHSLNKNSNIGKDHEIIPAKSVQHIETMLHVNGTTYTDQKALYIKYLFFIAEEKQRWKNVADQDDQISSVITPAKVLNTDDESYTGYLSNYRVV